MLELMPRPATLRDMVAAILPRGRDPVSAALLFAPWAAGSALDLIPDDISGPSVWHGIARLAMAECASRGAVHRVALHRILTHEAGIKRRSLDLELRTLRQVAHDLVTESRVAQAVQELLRRRKAGAA